MPAVLEAEEKAITSSKKPCPPQLMPYLFKPGQVHVRSPGRPKGSRSAETLYLESLPIKARQWVKSDHPSVLIDARKIALPIESDTPAASSTTLIAWLEQHTRLPNPPGQPALLDDTDAAQRRAGVPMTAPVPVEGPTSVTEPRPLHPTAWDNETFS